MFEFKVKELSSKLLLFMAAVLFGINAFGLGLEAYQKTIITIIAVMVLFIETGINSVKGLKKLDLTKMLALGVGVLAFINAVFPLIGWSAPLSGSVRLINGALAVFTIIEMFR